MNVAKTIDFDASVITNIEGNIATLVDDVQVIGKDTLVEVDASILAVEPACQMTKGCGRKLGPRLEKIRSTKSALQQ